jgi:hypothetical protein
LADAGVEGAEEGDEVPDAESDFVPAAAGADDPDSDPDDPESDDPESDDPESDGAFGRLSLR